MTLFQICAARLRSAAGKDKHNLDQTRSVSSQSAHAGLCSTAPLTNMLAAHCQSTLRSPACPSRHLWFFVLADPADLAAFPLASIPRQPWGPLCPGLSQGGLPSPRALACRGELFLEHMGDQAGWSLAHQDCWDMLDATMGISLLQLFPIPDSPWRWGVSQ